MKRGISSKTHGFSAIYVDVGGSFIGNIETSTIVSKGFTDPDFTELNAFPEISYFINKTPFPPSEHKEIEGWIATKEGSTAFDANWEGPEWAEEKQTHIYNKVQNLMLMRLGFNLVGF